MYIKSKNGGCGHCKHNTFFNIHYRCFSLWNRNSNITSSDFSRNYQLVRSIDRWFHIGHWNELHNSKHQCNHKLLC